MTAPRRRWSFPAPSTGTPPTPLEDLRERAERDRLEEILAALNQLPSQLRVSLTDQLWAEIPQWVDEWNYNAAQAANTPLIVTPQTSGLEVISSIVVAVPAGATAVVQLGLMTMPVGAGVTAITGSPKVMQTSDLRSVTASGAGPTFLWLTGKQAPTYGVLAK